MQVLTFNISDQFLPFVEAALTRLSYLHSEVDWSFDAKAQSVSAQCPGEMAHAAILRKELYFQLYREKIQADTSRIRQQLYGAIRE